MTLKVNHAFVSPKPQGGDSTRIYGPQWNADLTVSGTADNSQLNGNVVQAVTSDTNVTGAIALQNLTLGWTGTLAAARLNSNVVQGITNDTNVHGTISAQNLTFSWSGLLGLARGGTNADLSATGAAKSYLKQASLGAAITVGTIPASDIASGAALTQANDTNVTLTLGGTPAASLLAATSITAGWTGTLAAGRGGFGADVSAQSGVPLFAAGVATFTSTNGTGNFARTTNVALVTPALGVPTSGTLTSCTGLPLSGLTTQAAFTFVGNNTGSSAVPTAVDISALTSKASPASTDLVMISDQAASGAWKKVTVSSLTASAGVSSIATNTGAFTLSHGLTNSTNDLQIDMATQRGVIAGLTLSTAGSSATFAVSAGVAVDSAQTDFMKLTAAISKTTSAWTVGSTNGSLASGETIANSTWYHVHEIKRPDTGVVDILTSQAPGPTSVLPATFTVTIATPGVITCNGHGLAVGAPFVPTTTGALPTGMTAGTTYFVKTVTDINTIGTFAATQGGAAINTTGSQSGTHTITANPPLPANYTLFRRIGSLLTDGSAHWVLFKQYGDEFTWGVPVQDVSTGSLTTTPTSSALSIPPGFNLEAVGSAYATRSAVQVAILVWNPDLADQAVSEGAAPQPNLLVGTNGGTAIVAAGQIRVRTNTSQQIRYVAQSASTTFKWTTVSWHDTRGRFA